MKFAALTGGLVLVACHSSAVTVDGRAVDGAAPLVDIAPASAGAVTKSDGVTPANFACNHSFTDGPVGSTVTEHFHVDALPSGTNSGVTLTLVDGTTAQPIGTSSMSSDAGDLSLDVAGNSRVAWLSHSDGSCARDSCVDTYQFNQLTLANGAAATGTMAVTVWEIDDYAGFISAGGLGPSRNVPAGALLGTVTDCDGDPVMNAHVRFHDAPLCNQSASPCLWYDVAGGALSNTATNADGRFLLLGAPLTAFNVTATGVLSGSTVEAELASADVVGIDQAFSLAALTPLRN